MNVPSEVQYTEVESTARPAAIIAVLAGAACTTVRTTNAGHMQELAAKDENCAIRFYRLGTPSSDYQEIGSAWLEGSNLRVTGRRRAGAADPRV